MKNTMFTGENINEKVSAVLEAVQGLLDCLKPNEDRARNATTLERVHSLYFLKAVGELKDLAGVVKVMNEVSEEEFTSLVTNDGKRDLERAEMEMMLHMMMDVAKKKNSGE